MPKKVENTSYPTIFEKQEVRRVWHDEMWYFSVSDIVGILSESKDVKQYIKKMRARDLELSVNWGTICTPLAMISKDGKRREEIAASLENIFRIIQSISSPTAEPFKRWLAKVGKERIDEIADPELAVTRAKQIYEKKGYPKDWVDKRMRGIAVRNTLTDEWKNRGASKSIEYAILTVEKDSQGFKALKTSAKIGGGVAGRTRKDIEKQTGKRVISKGNFKSQKLL